MRLRDEERRQSSLKLVRHIDANTLDIWLHKKGGDFDIFDGKLVVHPGNFNPKKDFITVKRITATDRKSQTPSLSRLEKINGDIYDFSTNKKQLKQPVDVWLPCHPITHPHLQEIRLKAKFKGEEDWVYHDWTLFGEDPQYPVMEFTTDRLGTFVATVQPRVERVTLTDQGLLYNARINRYISLRFPKRCIDHDTNIEIRILPFDMAKALIVKEDLHFSYPDLTDFELATDYFEIVADDMKPFRRMVSVKIPTIAEGFTEEHRDEIIIMRRDMEINQWFMIESNLKITRTTIAFDTRSLGSAEQSKRRENIFSIQFDTKELGRFVILRAPAKRKLRMKNALPVLETKMSMCRREILIFKKMLKKSWNIWVELVKPSQVSAVIAKRERDGMTCVSQPADIGMDLDGKPEYVAPVTTESPHADINLELTESDINFSKDLENSRRNSSLEFINIYEVESDENIVQSAKSITKKHSRSKSFKKDFSYIEIEDCTDCGLITVSGGVQPVEESPLRPYFIETHLENLITFEIEPRDAELSEDTEAVIKYFVENTSTADGLTTKTMMRECEFVITAEQVAEYFWVEPVPEPVVDEPKPEMESLSSDALAIKELGLQREIKPSAERMKEQVDTVMRLSAPIRPRRMIYREPRVLTGRSLQTLSRLIEEGLTLAVYLDMPDSTITGIGFDALSNGLSLADVTYRILLRWKRSTRARGESAVDELMNALRSMGRDDLVTVMADNHRKNFELTPASFTHLHTEEDGEDLAESHPANNNVLPVKQFTF